MRECRQHVDVIYVAASARDARYTRICVASIRYFYPDIRIKLLPGGRLERGLTAQLARFWAVDVADVPCGDYGWGFVKLEPLFGPTGERFLVVDSDTIFAGRVLDGFDASAAKFIVDDERQTEDEARRLYYDWRRVGEVEPATRPPHFLFNSGQWFGTAGLLTRRDFASAIDWDAMPRRLRYPALFMPGEQGALNYVLNQKALEDEFLVERRKIMCWPGCPNALDGLDATSVATKTAPPLIIHWAGLKAIFLRTMAGYDLLRHFEDLYFTGCPLAVSVVSLPSGVTSGCTSRSKSRAASGCAGASGSASPDLPGRP